MVQFPDVALATVELVWAIAAATMLIVALFNLTVITIVSGRVVTVLRHYDDQRRRGDVPVFAATDTPEIDNFLCWGEDSIAGFRENGGGPGAPAETSRGYS